jgi:hypothetical protein
MLCVPLADTKSTVLRDECICCPLVFVPGHCRASRVGGLLERAYVVPQYAARLYAYRAIVVRIGTTPKDYAVVWALVSLWVCRIGLPSSGLPYWSAFFGSAVLVCLLWVCRIGLPVYLPSEHVHREVDSLSCLIDEGLRNASVERAFVLLAGGARCCRVRVA